MTDNYGEGYRVRVASLEYVSPGACESLEMSLGDFVDVARADAFRKVSGMR